MKCRKIVITFTYTTGDVTNHFKLFQPHKYFIPS